MDDEIDKMADTNQDEPTERQKRELLKIHRGLGHPQPNELGRALRNAGVKRNRAPSKTMASQYFRACLGGVDEATEKRLEEWAEREVLGVEAEEQVERAAWVVKVVPEKMVEMVGKVGTAV